MAEHSLMYNEAMRFSVDMTFRWGILFAAENVTYNKTPLYNYCLREGSIMTSSSLQKIQTGVNGFRAYCQKMIDTGEYPEITTRIFPRWMLGVLRTASKILPFSDFTKLLEYSEYQKHLPTILRFPETKARMLSRLLKISPYIFYRFCQKF